MSSLFGGADAPPPAPGGAPMPPAPPTELRGKNKRTSPKVREEEATKHRMPAAATRPRSVSSPSDALASTDASRRSSFYAYDIPSESLPMPSLDLDATRACLRRKWIVLVGESFARMLFDYAEGVLSGAWTARAWPATLSNHGPAHPAPCRGKDDRACWYDFRLDGARVTFFWQPLASWSDDAAHNGSLFERTLGARTVGAPDAIVVCNGAWEVGYNVPGESNAFGPTQRALLAAVDRVVAGAGDATRRAEWPAAFARARPPLKVWLQMATCSDKAALRAPMAAFIHAADAELRARPGWALFSTPRMTHVPADVFARPGAPLAACAPGIRHGCRLGIHHPADTRLAAVFDALVHGLCVHRRTRRVQS